MQRAFYNLTQSMLNHQRSLDAISNNLTNINTAGYKKDEIRLFNHGAKVENASLLERLKARSEESAIKVSTVKAPHTYMKAVGTRELEKILEEELGNEDTKRHTC